MKILLSGLLCLSVFLPHAFAQPAPARNDENPYKLDDFKGTYERLIPYVSEVIERGKKIGLQEGNHFYLITERSASNPSLVTQKGLIKFPGEGDLYHYDISVIGPRMGMPIEKLSFWVRPGKSVHIDFHSWRARSSTGDLTDDFGTEEHWIVLNCEKNQPAVKAAECKLRTNGNQTLTGYYLSDILKDIMGSDLDTFSVEPLR